MSCGKDQGKRYVPAALPPVPGFRRTLSPISLSSTEHGASEGKEWQARSRVRAVIDEPTPAALLAQSQSLNYAPLTFACVISEPQFSGGQGP